jgi:hypothetical protein
MGVGIDEVGGMTAQPPQGGAKVSKSAFLTDVQPKAASDIGTPNPTPLESKERHQPLRVNRKIHHLRP